MIAPKVVNGKPLRFARGDPQAYRASWVWIGLPLKDPISRGCSTRITPAILWVPIGVVRRVTGAIYGRTPTDTSVRVMESLRLLWAATGAGVREGEP